MKVIVYFCVATIAALSVALGLDWVSAPMSPMPASPYELRAAVPPPPPAVVARVEPRVEPKVEPKPQAAAPAIAAVQPAAAPVPATPEQQAPSIIAEEPNTAAATPPAPRCDVEACASAYRSFMPEDCTYQPNEGPRRFCTRGTPPAIATPAIVPSTAPEARAQACNIAACAQSYPRSFSAEDCTFLPANGPRRVCTK